MRGLPKHSGGNLDTVAAPTPGGAILILIVTAEGVFPEWTPDPIRRTALELESRDVPAAFLSAVAAGALMR